MKKEKKYLIYGIALVLVTLIGVSLSYFVAYIEGDKKQIGVSTADLKIIFNNEEAISGENIKPGWSITKTFSVENRSDDVFKYNISIEDLVNTFFPAGFYSENSYLQYKITSTNGYNMTEYKDVPNNYILTGDPTIPMDRILAYNIEIPQGIIQEYTIELVYRNDENVDQSHDMGAKLSGMLYISECKTPSLAEYIIDTYTLNDKVRPNIYYNYSAPNSDRLETRNELFYTKINDMIYYTKLTEDGSTVYNYFANTENNWVKFGKYQTDWYYCKNESTGEWINLPSCPEGYTKFIHGTKDADMYWKIIRTNEDGGVRLLYAGIGVEDDIVELPFIGISMYNPYIKDPLYNGYMYGTSGSLENNRTNENSSLIKQVLES